jgi:two-component system response regulator HydG
MQATQSSTSAFKSFRAGNVGPVSVEAREMVPASPASVRNARVAEETPGTAVTAGLPALHLLVVDDDDSVRNACCEIARKMGFVVVSAADLAGARAILKHHKVDLLLLDLKLAGASGLTLLEEVKVLHAETSVVVMTAFATVASAVEAMRIGAGDYLTKPFSLEELMTVLERAAERTHFDLESRRLRDKLRNPKGSGHLIGRSPEMEKLYRILSKVANTQHAALILGESGTGKELVARSIHFNGPNARRPFIPVDCGSLVPELIESELFGYVKGAHLGANRVAAVHSKDGLLTAADGGTVFLDEIGELPLDLQAKLLRALQEKAVYPVGGTQPVPVSTRVLAATNRNLGAMVDAGRFRRDLYFRLNVVTLRIPPLRDRKEDIPALVQHFLDRAQKENGKSYTMSSDALRTMMAYSWPGNVRELESAIERACALSSGPIVHMGDLPTQLHDFAMHERVSHLIGGELGAGELGVTGEMSRAIVSIAELEKEAILGTIRELKGDKLMAAKLLGIGKTTLYRKLKEYGVPDVDEF